MNLNFFRIINCSHILKFLHIPFFVGWMKLFDQTTGRSYYVNQYLNITQWESPNAISETSSAAAPAHIASVTADQNVVKALESDVQPFGVPDNLIADRIAQAALNKQKSAGNKTGRFKKQEIKEDEEETSEFRRLFNAAHKNQGNKDATTGACNVR